MGWKVDGVNAEMRGGRIGCMLLAMAQPLPANFPPPETEGNDEARLAWERARLAEADADFAAGRYISGEAALDWLDRWAAGQDLEEPKLD